LKTSDPSLTAIRDAVKYATHVEDLTRAVSELKKKGILIEEV